MEVISNTKYQKIQYNRKDDILLVYRSPETEWMDDNTYKDEISLISNTIIQHKIPKMMINNYYFRFVITPDIQIWSNQHVFVHAIKGGLKMIAFVESEEAFSQISVEQIMDEEQARMGFNSRFFKIEAEALTWLQEMPV